MIFTVSTSVLLGAMNTISGAIGGNITLPILEDVLFELKDGQVRLAASDLETSMTVQVDVMGSEEGSVAIPGKMLLDILKSLPDQPLSISSDEESQTIKIVSQNGVFEMMGEKGDDFPTISYPEALNQLSIKSSVLSRAISNTLFAVSNDELRRTMTGVLFEINDSGMTCVATDAHKLARYNRSDVSFDLDYSPTFIIPKKALTLLSKALPQDDTQVQITYDDANAFFSFNSITLVCRLIDGRYPNYNAVIPANNEQILTINRADLQSALKRIAIFANKENYQVILELKENEVLLVAQDLDFSNKGQERLTCGYEGDEMNIAFNSKFFLEILNILKSEEVCLKMSSPSRAVLIQPLNQEDGEDILMLIMPIMLHY